MNTEKDFAKHHVARTDCFDVAEAHQVNYCKRRR